MGPTMQDEPLRLPAWVWAILTLIAVPAGTYLIGGDWQYALGATLLASVPAGGVVAKAESKRAFTDSPTLVAAQKAIDASPVKRTVTKVAKAKKAPDSTALAAAADKALKDATGG